MTDLCVAVAGVRPQYVKAAALEYELRRWEQHSGRPISRLLVDTAQHHDPALSSRFMAELALPPAVKFDHSDRSSPSAVVASSIAQLAALARNWPPATTLVVFGDANPTLVGAVVARIMGIRLVHVEAGERRDGREQEDFNSRVADQTADLALCVTSQAVANLAAEGFRGHAIRTGDLAYRWFESIAASAPVGQPGALVTLHRPQNMRAEFIRRVAATVCDVGIPVRWVAHPRAAPILPTALAGLPVSVLSPQGYRAFLGALRAADFVVSDAGGVVREAHLFGTPVVVLREAGAWQLLDGAHVMRVGADLKNLETIVGWAATAGHRVVVDSPLVDVAAIDRGIEQLVTGDDRSSFAWVSRSEQA